MSYSSCVGVSDEQPLDTQQLVKENCLLRDKIPGKNLMLTAYRCELMKRAGKTEVEFLAKTLP